MDENTIVMHRNAKDNEYFHPDFHSSLNMGIHYLGENYGIDVVKEYLTRFTRNVYKNAIKAIKETSLKAIEDNIIDTYTKEKAIDAVKTELSDNSLKVNISYCPAVKHLKNTGRKVSPWLRYTTDFIMSTLAEVAGASFEVKSYDEETGKSEYIFNKM